MPDVTIVYWRDIPAQVIVGKGRRGAKRPLPERFEREAQTLANLTGWDIADIRRSMELAGTKPGESGPWWERIWD